MQFKVEKVLKFLDLFTRVCVYVHAMCRDVRGRLVGVGSLLPLCGSRDETQVIKFGS